MHLTVEEKAVLSGSSGTEGDRMAMQIVVESARLLGADRLIEISSAHIDGVLFHGPAGVHFSEALAGCGARVKVPATTNVSALNLLNPDQCRLSAEDRALAFRQVVAFENMGCRPSWTCAPYQAGARPTFGEQIAWGESNAVAFANSVLGARTNRYGDYLDIACAVTARAPFSGLHVTANRHAKLVFDVSELSAKILAEEAFYPVLGALIGQEAGDAVCAVVGLPADVHEDRLKAMLAGAASKGAVGLLHVVGVTPEAPTLAAVLQGQTPEQTIKVTPDQVCDMRNALSHAAEGGVNCIALGSPHFSGEECRRLLQLAGDKAFAVPVYLCIGQHTVTELASDGVLEALEHLGVCAVVGTCVVVTPILPDEPGVMMTNSAKFAHYASGNAGYLPVFGNLRECVLSGQAGRILRDPEGWV